MAQYAFLAIPCLVAMNANAQEPPNLTTPIKEPERSLPTLDKPSLARVLPYGSSLSPGPPPRPVSMWGSAYGPLVTRWYGWQTMIPLVSADIFFAVAFGADQSYATRRTALILTPTVHLFTGLIVHGIHGRVDKGAAAFALSFGLPTLGILIGTATSGEVGIAVTTTGALMAQVIDVALLSSETVRVLPEYAKSTPSRMFSSVTVLPMLDSTRAGLVLVGQF